MPRQGFFSPATTHEQEDIEVSDDEAGWGFLDQPVNQDGDGFLNESASSSRSGFFSAGYEPDEWDGDGTGGRNRWFNWASGR